MRLNPVPFVIIGFLLVGLVWSGGHVAWLVALGVFVLLAAIGTAVTQNEASKKARR